MGHRIVKRVPLDFNAPLCDVWAGYIMPDSVLLPDCADCGSTGYSPTALWLSQTFYDHNVADDHGWGKQLTQADVDALVEAGRLRKLVKRKPTEDNPRAWEWISVPRSAEDVNAADTHGMGELSMDAINVHILTDSRCERLGAPTRCATCEGEGNTGTPEQRDAYENWEGTEPPEGDGWQMWETTSEGSPQTPVFATPEALADYCAEHCSIFAGDKMPAADWLRMFVNDTLDVGSMLVSRGPEPADA